MTALRELLASFKVEVDPEGNLPKGNRQVDALRDKLMGVDRAALGIGDRLRTAFAGLPASVRAATAGIPAAVAGRVSAFTDAVGVRLRGAFDGVRQSLNEPRLGFLSGLANMKNALVATGAVLATQQVWRFVDSTIQGAAAVDDMAKRLGITTDEFQELQGVAQLGGAEVGAIATAFSVLSRNALEFSQTGKGEAGEAFEKLGVSVKDANGEVRPAIELFYEAGDALAGLDNVTERQAYAQRLMGRSARELLPVFNDLASMTAEQRAEVRALSIVYGEDFIQASAEADDKMLIAGKVLEGLKAKLVGALLPAIVGGVEALQSFAKWLSVTSEKVSFTRGAFILGAFAISPYIAKLNALVTLGGGWIKTLGGMGRAIGTFTKTAAPLMLLFVALEDIFTFFQGGDSLIGRGLMQLDKWLGGNGETVREMTAAFRDLWKWIFGGGDGKKVKAFYQETLDGVALVVNDMFAKLGIREKSGIEGLEASRSEGGNLTAFGRLLGGVSQQDFNSLGLIPASAGGRAGTTVIDNSTKSVQVVMPQGSSPMQTADAVSKRLESDRASVAARVP